jgi:methionyl aminopeptidase
VIRLKTHDQLKQMRWAGLIVGRLLNELAGEVKAGVTTRALDKFAEKFIQAHGASPAFRGVRSTPDLKPFPGVICASINEELVHGIPGERALKDGDVLKVDVGCRLDGYYSDAARTYIVGSVPERVSELVRTTSECLDAAIAASIAGNRLRDIAKAVQGLAESRGFGVVRDYVGHGIGTSLHEEPQVPNYVPLFADYSDAVLRPGMVLAIEPMVNEGTWKVVRRNGDWTVRTADGLCCAHFEHTIAILAEGNAVLTDIRANALDK